MKTVPLSPTVLGKTGGITSSNSQTLSQFPKLTSASRLWSFLPQFATTEFSQIKFYLLIHLLWPPFTFFPPLPPWHFSQLFHSPSLFMFYLLLSCSYGTFFPSFKLHINQLAGFLFIWSSDWFCVQVFGVFWCVFGGSWVLFVFVPPLIFFIVNTPWIGVVSLLRIINIAHMHRYKLFW